MAGGKQGLWPAVRVADPMGADVEKKQGLIAHTYMQRQTQMQTYSEGNITDQKHQSCNHTHYMHHLAIPATLLTSVFV